VSLRAAGGGDTCTAPAAHRRCGAGEQSPRGQGDCFVGLPGLLATTHQSPMSSPPCVCLIRLLYQARGYNKHLVPPFLILKRGDYRRAFVPLRVKESNLNSPPSLLQAKPFPPPMSRRHPLSCRAAASPRPPISGFEMGGPQGGMRSYSLRLPL
jgi:hypothetical protein